mmetsp:Transcript_21781/g.20914  ORF Transcript_21781/g.20914 Transcript_21781/m.20914 type:complete len:117 (-) Transcript_21781:186-536(-)
MFVAVLACQDILLSRLFFADGEEPEDYKGGRDYASLVNHVEENLLIACLISDPDNGCSDKEKAYIEKMSSKSKVDVVSQLDRLSGMKNQSMKKELKGWVNQRLRILNQVSQSQQEL